MASVAQPLASDKFAALGLLDKQAIEQICREQGHQWKEVKLPPGKTLQCFGWQVLMGNVPLDAVAHHQQMQFSGPAFCMARQRLPLELMQEVSGRVAQQVIRAAGANPKDDGCYKGKREYRIDGSSASLPDSAEIRLHFGCSGVQKPGCGYPTTHLLLLTGPGGAAIEAICSPLRTGDMTHASKTHAQLACCWETVSSAGGAICISCPASSWMDCSPLITPARSAGAPRPSMARTAASCGHWGGTINWSSIASPRIGPNG